MRRLNLTITALLFAFAATHPSASSAETYWPMHDSGSVQHDLKSRWGDPVAWCGEAVADELARQLAVVENFVVVGQAVALSTQGTQVPAREALVGDARSYAFWRLDPTRTLVVELSCEAPTVCTVTAHLIVREAGRTCLERWRTVAYRGAPPSPKPTDASRSRKGN